MTKSASRRVGANDWLQDYYSPVVGILGSQDAELLCRKNNLTLVELLQPFGKVNEHLTVKDPDGVIHNVPTLNLNFQVSSNKQSLSIPIYKINSYFSTTFVIKETSKFSCRTFEEILFVFLHQR